MDERPLSEQLQERISVLSNEMTTVQHELQVVGDNLLQTTRQLQTLQGGSGALEPLSQISGWQFNPSDTATPGDTTDSAGYSIVGVGQYLAAGSNVRFSRPANLPYLVVDALPGNCYDYVVAADGSGTHTTLFGATGALAAAWVNSQDRISIYVCPNHEETVSSALSLGAATCTYISITSEPISPLDFFTFPQFTGAVGLTAFINITATSGNSLPLTIVFKNLQFYEAGNNLSFVTGKLTPAENVYFENVSFNGIQYIFNVEQVISSSVHAFDEFTWAAEDNDAAFYNTTINPFHHLDAAAFVSGIYVRNSVLQYVAHLADGNGLGTRFLNNIVFEGNQMILNSGLNYPWLDLRPGGTIGTAVTGGSGQLSVRFIGNRFDWAIAPAINLYPFISTLCDATFNINDIIFTGNEILIDNSSSSPVTTAIPVFADFQGSVAGTPQSIVITGNSFVQDDHHGDTICIAIGTNAVHVRIDNVYRGFGTDVSDPGGVAMVGGTSDHGTLSGLVDDDHSQYPLLAGRAGGQTVYGGTSTGDSFLLYGNTADNAFIQINADIEFDVAAGHRFDFYAGPGSLIGILDDPALELYDQMELRLYDANSSNLVSFRSTAVVATDVIYEVPTAVLGDVNKVLSISGFSAGVATLAWTAGGGAGTTDVQEDGVSVSATATALNFIEPDATLVTNSPAGTGRIDMSKYALLAGRSGGQTLQGGTAASNNLTLESTANATKGVIKALDKTIFANSLLTTADEFYAGVVGTTSPKINFDAGDNIQYQRASNTWHFLNSSTVFSIDPTGPYIYASGALHLYATGNTFYTALADGTARGANITYRWPVTDPTAGQHLQATAPVASVSTLSWVSPVTVAGHAVHNETSAALTQRADIHFMGFGVFAQDNASRTEVIIGTTYDAIVDSNDTNAAGKGNVYSTLQAAITDGRVSIFFRASTDGSDITINAEAVTRIVGEATASSSVPVNITCNKSDVSFENLLFNGKSLNLAGARDIAFAVAFTGAVTSGTGAINNAAGITSAATSIAWDTGANGGLRTRGYVRIDDEVLNYNAGGGASSGTLTVANANLRGIIESAALAHADNAVITDLTAAHLSINAADCEVVECRFVGCSNVNAQGIMIFSSGTRARITASKFLANSLWSLITLYPEGQLTTSIPSGPQIVGCEFDSNLSGRHIELWHGDNNSRTGTDTSSKSGQFSGNLFRNFNGDVARLYAGLYNIAGNTFDGVTRNTLTFIVNQPADAGTTATTYTATSMTDSTPRTWLPGQWVGHTITSGATSGTITANGVSDVTITAWSAGTPAGGAGYTITAGVTATQTAIPWDGGAAAATILATLPARGRLLLASGEIVYYGSYTAAGSPAAGGFLNLKRGCDSLTAATTGADNDTITNQSQNAIYVPGGPSVFGGFKNLLSGNTFANMTVICTQDGAINTAGLTWSTNIISGTGSGLKYIYTNASYQFFDNSIGNTAALIWDFRSGGTQVVFGGTFQAGGGVQNVPTDLSFFVASGTLPTGLLTVRSYPSGAIISLGRIAGDTAVIVQPMINKTGGASVATQVVDTGVAVADSFVTPPVGRSTALLGVVVTGGIADGSTDQIATAGTINVLCDAGAVVIGDALSHSLLTAGTLSTNAAPAAGTVMGIARTAKAGGGVGTTGAVRMLIQRR